MSPCSGDLRQQVMAFCNSFAPLEGEGEVQEKKEVLVPQLVRALSTAELSAATEPRCRRYHAWRTPKPQSHSLGLGHPSPLEGRARYLHGAPARGPKEVCVCVCVCGCVCVCVCVFGSLLLPCTIVDKFNVAGLML